MFLLEMQPVIKQQPLPGLLEKLDCAKSLKRVATVRDTCLLWKGILRKLGQDDVCPALVHERAFTLIVGHLNLFKQEEGEECRILVKIFCVFVTRIGSADLRIKRLKTLLNLQEGEDQIGTCHLILSDCKYHDECNLTRLRVAKCFAQFSEQKEEAIQLFIQVGNHARVASVLYDVAQGLRELSEEKFAEQYFFKMIFLGW